MRTFRVTIIGDKYPTEYTIQATGFPTAVSRAIREWQRRFKGSRTPDLRIHVVKGAEVDPKKLYLDMQNERSEANTQP